MILLMNRSSFNSRRWAVGRRLMRLVLLCKLSVFLSTFGCVTCAQPLLVAAASDLAPLASSLTDGFLKASGHSLRFSFGSSGLLAEQIRNGAPFDVYLSANQQLVSELAESGQIRKDSVKTYAIGRIGLWSASGKVTRLEDLARADLRHIAIPNPRHAPYGVAAEEVLRRAGLMDQVRPKLVYGENVRQALEFAQSGNAGAVLTAWTLLNDRGGILIPERLHNPVRQAGGVTSSSKQAAAAEQFLRYLTSAAGQAVLMKFGFSSPSR